ncbi:MAG TPA: molybdopterin molybdotransferase MoeA [Candidatus Didemnitutus sp.]|nr:molybdopterin molybdotransferase MoeA [Candidatus Didemnitutus sp.]
MMSVSESLQAILDRAQPLEATPVPLASALGRVLRENARADIDSPPFDASAMDGYALRRADAGSPLKIIGTAAAGAAFDRELGTGECVRIFTGAPIPAGADCVAKQEDVTRPGDTIRTNWPGGPNFIRRRGENRRAGHVVVPAGTRLGAPELAALACIGAVEVPVARQARCVHVVTGDELVSPDRTPTGAQIRDTNSSLIRALLAQHDGEFVGHAHVRDDLAAACRTVEALPAHDVLLISGGAGTGERDVSRPLLESLGYTLHFQAVNLRPGKPLVFATRGTRLAFVLPGNPVSHWVVFQLFIAPLLSFLQTGARTTPPLLAGNLALYSKLPPPDPRPTFWPCRAVIVNGVHQLTPLSIASSGDSAGLVGANALLSVPPTSPDSSSGLLPGSAAQFILCS